MLEHFVERKPLISEECIGNSKVQDGKIKDEDWSDQNVHEGEKIISCHHCEQTFNNINGLKMHCGRVHKELKSPIERHQCTFCEKSYSSYYPLWYHIETVHKKSERHKCDFCDKSYPVPSLLQYHIEVKHNESGTRKFQCRQNITRRG